MVRKELAYAGFRAIAVDTYKEGHTEANLYRLYLSELRLSPLCECENAPALKLQLSSPESGGPRRAGRLCRLFAINGGRGIYMPTSPNSMGSTAKRHRHNDSTNYSFVLVTNGCDRMDDCMAQLEAALGLEEGENCLGYDDEEVRWLIQTRLI